MVTCRCASTWYLGYDTLYFDLGCYRQDWSTWRMPPWKIKLRTKRQNNNNITKSIPPTKQLGSGWNLKSFCSSHTFISQTSLPHPMFQWPDPQRYRCPCDLADVGQGSGSGLFTRFGNHLKLVNGQWVRMGEKNHSWKEGLMQRMEEHNFGNPTTPFTF